MKFETQRTDTESSVLGAKGQHFDPCRAQRLTSGSGGPKRGPGEGRGQHLLSLPLCSFPPGLSPPVTGRWGHLRQGRAGHLLLATVLVLSADSSFSKQGPRDLRDQDLGSLLSPPLLSSSHGWTNGDPRGRGKEDPGGEDQGGERRERG